MNTLVDIKLIHWKHLPFLDTGHSDCIYPSVIIWSVNTLYLVSCRGCELGESDKIGKLKEPVFERFEVVSIIKMYILWQMKDIRQAKTIWKEKEKDKYWQGMQWRRFLHQAAIVFSLPFVFLFVSWQVSIEFILPSFCSPALQLLQTKFVIFDLLPR